MTTGRVTAVWGVAAVVALAAFGPPFGPAVTASDGRVGDLVQEWLSARDYAAGYPVYSPSAEALRRHVGVDAPGFGLAYNAHPPASVLVTLPLGAVDYRTAHATWNLGGIVLLTASLVGLVRGAERRVTAPVVLAAVTLSVACHPLLLQFSNAQWNMVLLALGVAGWRADRAGYGAAAGLAVGTAAALKLFPAFLLVYFVGARRWRAAGVTIGVVAGWHLAAVAVLGTDALVTYATAVVPGLTPHQSSWQNVSLNGFARRLFDPDPAENILPLLRAPFLARIAWQTAAAGVAAVCARLAWAARTSGDRDRAFAAAAVGALLASPLTWTHSFVLLVGPALLAWDRATSPGRRLGLAAVAVGLMLPVHFTPQLLLGEAVTAGLLSRSNAPLTPAENLLACTGPLAALVGLFALVAAARPGPPLSPAPRAGNVC